MIPHAHGCLGVHSLAAYVDGTLDRAEVGRVDSHVDACSECQGDLAALALARTRPPRANLGVVQDERVVPGTRFGRYVVLSELGRGAMGIVLRAYDPELDRTLALKILQPEVWMEAPQALRQSLLREAKAMAKLTSAHVVTVHDVVSDEHGLALAMEFVDGRTFGAWLQASGTPHRWTIVLERCIAAGRGLEAAHAQGVVHRDFKPDNILCGSDGRTLVTDFGLAQLVGGDADGARHLAGTPAYMAPEVLDSGTATAQSDQFSFCVTTYEALYGVRPFDARDLSSLQEQIQSGVVAKCVSSSRVPRAVRELLLQGLRASPAERHASMAALLRALEVALTRRRRRWMAAVVALALAAALGGIAVSGIARSTVRVSCEVPLNVLESTWGPLQRQQIDRQLTALGASPESLVRLEQVVELYRTDWREAKRNICQATHDRGEQSDSLLDRRMACLKRRRSELAALAQVLGAADEPRSAVFAIEAVQGLRAPAGCSQQLAFAGASAGTFVDYMRVARGLAAIDRAMALVATGDFRDALEVLAALDGDGELAWPPQVTTRLEFARGKAHALLGNFDSARVAYFDALEAAQRVADDQLIANIWIELVVSDGASAYHFELAHAHQRAADAALARLPASEELQARYLFATARVALAQDDVAAALPLLVQARAATSALRGEQHLELLPIHTALCDAYRSRRDFAQATDECNRAVRVGEAVLGEGHLRLAESYNSLGKVKLDQGELAEARSWHLRALDATAVGGSQSPARAMALSYLATTWFRQGDIDQAGALFNQAETLFVSHHPDHLLRYVPVLGLAAVAHTSGEFTRARLLYEDSLAIIERQLGEAGGPRSLPIRYNLAILQNELGDPDASTASLRRVIEIASSVDENHPLIARATQLLAAVAESTGDRASAIVLAEQAVAAAEKAHVGHDLGLVTALGRLGVQYWRAGRAREAVRILERAVRMVDGSEVSLYVVGTLRFGLARALHDAGEPDRALELGRTAREELVRSTDRRNKRRLAELDAWLPTITR